MSVEKLIVDHMETWTSALQTRSTAGRGSSGKIDLYGIKKLRELILELAVRGKLVPQDPNDEPASELLKRNEERKKELARNNGMKTTASTNIHGNEYYIDTPEKWSWIRLGNLAKFIDYRGKTPHKKENGIRLITAKNIRKGYIDLNPEEFISEEDYISWMTRGFPKCGDILFTTEAPLGNAAIIDLDGKFALAQRSICFQWHTPEISPFMLIQILAIPFQSQLSDKSTGMTATGIKASKLKEIPVILPPYQEQIRIVSKVQEFMSLCDQLEQQSLTTLDAHQQLVETLLGTLTDSQNAEELAENWARISEHFDTLFTTEASVDALKQTILQLAVMGKLVPHDPNDEPASELLKRIAQEKAQLVKEGKIKKQKPLPPISDEEKPFELPEGWEWIRLGNIGEVKGGGTPSKNNPDFWKGNIPWVSPKDMKVNYISKSQLNISKEAVLESSVHLIPENSLIFVVRGMILAHTFPVAITKKEVTINQDMKAISTNQLNTDFLIYLLKANETRVICLVDRSSHGTCKLVSDKLFNLVLPLPPLEEQFRITERINMLLAYCDRLKNYINLKKQTQLHLADALTDAAIN
ncbi:TPA: restriction endonuclease subunit S [Escherichia coli]|uniref:restriction endonuclease subunit S n=1 Tax=Escherichia sp. HH41S TaxID=2508714 RepID=UPI00136DED83|nr:restriction endonuclease subunit S [Escherichia sp. HH41S]MCX2159149.1 restriction endonuclease subunit S [Escherichia coli]MXE43057.1 restriction endonuclease subunit S [Escherichia sp. HH41S]HAP3736850.1 restriction endonuclease subunit S [Escherichia coli]HDK0462279.1 restriction endonuclease subunit S [Escherichia coli]HDK2015402.1 restriction endonuclease subunit S [Escherichia coli]